MLKQEHGVAAVVDEFVKKMKENGDNDTTISDYTSGRTASPWTGSTTVENFPCRQGTFVLGYDGLAPMHASIQCTVPT